MLLNLKCNNGNGHNAFRHIHVIANIVNLQDANDMSWLSENGGGLSCMHLYLRTHYMNISVHAHRDNMAIK